MTKLRRKLKQQAKKRAHKRTVQKRKAARMEKSIEESKLKEKEKLDAIVDYEIKRQDALEQGKPLPSAPKALAASHEELTLPKEKPKPIVITHGGLVHVERPGQYGKKKKTFSRKQMKRKEKGVERGVADQESLVQKVKTKLKRVKHRAQIRNADLDN